MESRLYLVCRPLPPGKVWNHLYVLRVVVFETVHGRDQCLGPGLSVGTFGERVVRKSYGSRGLVHFIERSQIFYGTFSCKILQKIF